MAVYRGFASKQYPPINRNYAPGTQMVSELCAMARGFRAQKIVWEDTGREAQQEVSNAIEDCTTAIRSLIDDVLLRDDTIETLRRELAEANARPRVGKEE